MLIVSQPIYRADRMVIWGRRGGNTLQHPQPRAQNRHQHNPRRRNRLPFVLVAQRRLILTHERMESARRYTRSPDPFFARLQLEGHR